LFFVQEVLQELREEHPIPGLVLRFRKLQKLSSTWLDGLAAQVRTEPDAVRGCVAPAPRLCSEWLQTSTRVLPIPTFRTCLCAHL
jgi:hypothetical protein